MAEFTGCETPIRYFLGRAFKLLPGGEHFDSWHNDIDRRQKRLYGLSINLSREPFSGGSFRIRNRATGEVLRAVTTSRFGDACLFRVHHTLEHMISAVRGEVPRHCYAGWFTSGQNYREVLRETAGPRDSPRPRRNAGRFAANPRKAPDRRPPPAPRNAPP